MTNPQSKKTGLVTKIAVGGLLLVAIVLVKNFFASSSDTPQGQEEQSAGASGAKPATTSTEAEADLAHESMNTILATMDDFQKQQEELMRRQQEEFQAQLNELRETISDRDNQIRAIQDQNGGSDYDSVLSGNSDTGNELPIGIGFDDSSSEYPINSNNTAPQQTGFVRVEPVGVSLIRAQSPDNDTLLDQLADFADRNSPVSSSNDNTKPILADSDSRSANAQEKPATVHPVMTLHPDMHLIKAKATGVIVGKIPKSGNIEDPFPISVMTSKENLAANGFTLPNLAGAIWGGTTYGDLSMVCVRARLTRVTFIFEDKTIFTYGHDSDETIAEIGQAQGFPCVPGKREGNFDKLALASVVATGTGEAGDAYARRQLEVQDTGSSSIQTIQSTSDFILGNMGQAAGNETANIIKEQLVSAYDVVVASSNTPLTVSIKALIPIDYDENGRKLIYEDTTEKPGDYLD